MDIKRFHEKHVRLTTIYGDTFTGIADYNDYDYLKSEWGGEEDGLFIGDFLVYHSQIASIEEVAVHGTAELWTEYLVLRRYRPEDAEVLYKSFGTEPAMYKYSGWNPYATPDMARDTVSRIIAWCASENIASKRTLEKVGMKLTDCENDGLSVGGRTYDKLTYEYRKKNS